jgi:hypothetical protein
LQTTGLKVSTGTIVDATIFYAPTSTRNRDRARDPELQNGELAGMVGETLARGISGKFG